MRLSTAMEIGNATIVDRHGTVLEFMAGKPCGCAIGSCLVGGGASQPIKLDDYYKLLKELFPQVEYMPPCPECGNEHGYGGRSRERLPGTAIECLYERHRWTKERIVSWIRQWEGTLPDHIADGRENVGPRTGKLLEQAALTPNTAGRLQRIQFNYEDLMVERYFTTIERAFFREPVPMRLEPVEPLKTSGDPFVTAGIKSEAKKAIADVLAQSPEPVKLEVPQDLEVIKEEQHAPQERRA